MELFGCGRMRKTIFIPTCFAWKARDSRLAGKQSQQFRLQLEAVQTIGNWWPASRSYLSTCREPIRDSHGSFLQSGGHSLAFSDLIWKATLNFLVWKARSVVAPWVGAMDVIRCRFETRLELRSSLQYLDRHASFLTCCVVSAVRVQSPISQGNSILQLPRRAWAPLALLVPAACPRRPEFTMAPSLEPTIR